VTLVLNRVEQDITLYKEAAMRYKKMTTPLACILLAAVMLILGCSNEAAPQQARDYLVKGYSFFTQSQWDRAIAEYSRAIELDPKLAAAYNYRGSAYGEKGDYDKAIADFNMAIELDPRFA
jgi:tetratricopeptide (TPR) repeat protein